jgi:hypothetical protein
MLIFGTQDSVGCDAELRNRQNIHKVSCEDLCRKHPPQYPMTIKHRQQVLLLIRAMRMCILSMNILNISLQLHILMLLPIVYYPRNSGKAKSGRAAGQLRHQARMGFLARNSPRALNIKEKWRRSRRK